MAARTLETQAEFLLPLLDRGLEVLDAAAAPARSRRASPSACCPAA